MLTPCERDGIVEGDPHSDSEPIENFAEYVLTGLELRDSRSLTWYVDCSEIPPRTDRWLVRQPAE